MATADLPYYVDDPLMDEERPKHRLHTEVKHSESVWAGFTVYAAWCSCAEWFSGGNYDMHGQSEAFDEHMRRVQQTVRAQPGENAAVPSDG